MDKIISYILAIIILLVIILTTIEYYNCEGTLVRGLFWYECIAPD